MRGERQRVILVGAAIGAKALTYTIAPGATTNTNPPASSTSKTSSSTASSSSTSSGASGASTLNGDFTTFLKLLTAQIQHQDPTSPMDTTQWTNQLVQYSSVEQLLKSNTYLQTIASNSGSTFESGVAYLGKTVVAKTATATLNGGAATWQYNLDGSARSATATIADSKGTTVWSGPLSGLAAGGHSFTWDGKDASGKAVGNGDYTLSIAAKSPANQAVPNEISLSGVVTSVSNASGAPLLQVGASTVALSSVVSVS